MSKPLTPKESQAMREYRDYPSKNAKRFWKRVVSKARRLLMRKTEREQ